MQEGNVWKVDNINDRMERTKAAMVKRCEEEMEEDLDIMMFGGDTRVY